MFSPTLRQMSYNITLVRTASKPLWTQPQWAEWCSNMASGDAIRKASVPLRDAWRKAAKKCKGILKKRPAKRLPRKATPFSLKRKQTMVSAGVRRTVQKKQRVLFEYFHHCMLSSV